MNWSRALRSFDPVQLGKAPLQLGGVEPAVDAQAEHPAARIGTAHLCAGLPTCVYVAGQPRTEHLTAEERLAVRVADERVGQGKICVHRRGVRLDGGEAPSVEHADLAM